MARLNERTEDPVYAVTLKSLKKLSDKSLRLRLLGVDRMTLDLQSKINSLREIRKVIEAEIANRGYTVEELIRRQL